VMVFLMIDSSENSSLSLNQMNEYLDPIKYCIMVSIIIESGDSHYALVRLTTLFQLHRFLITNDELGSF